MTQPAVVKCKTIFGKVEEYTATSIADLRQQCMTTAGDGKQVVLVTEGRILHDDGAWPISTLVYVTLKSQPTQNAPAQVTPAQATPTGLYRKTYTGKQLLTVVNNCHLVFRLLQDMAKQNPFILSYLAMDPNQVKTELIQLLSDPKFVLNIEGPDITCDPVAPYLTHPSGLNGAEIDERNIRYLMRTATFRGSYDKAKEAYLICDRDIEATLHQLRG
jgi:hypothetical protein